MRSMLTLPGLAIAISNNCPKAAPSRHITPATAASSSSSSSASSSSSSLIIIIIIATVAHPHGPIIIFFVSCRCESNSNSTSTFIYLFIAVVFCYGPRALRTPKTRSIPSHWALSSRLTVWGS